MCANSSIRKIASDERVVIIGKTGSGKTFLAKHLLKTCQKLLVLDSKGTLNDWNCQNYDPSAMDAEGFRLRLLGPFDGNDMDAIDHAYRVGDVTIYIDEAYSIFYDQRKRAEIEPILRCLTRGRERGVGVWVSTQRPVNMSKYVLTEAEHFFVFRLTDSNDRKLVANSIHENLEDKVTSQHGFFYYHISMDDPTYFTELKTSGKP